VANLHHPWIFELCGAPPIHELTVSTLSVKTRLITPVRCGFCSGSVKTGRR
jgi:hypothetical protein